MFNIQTSTVDLSYMYWSGIWVLPSMRGTMWHFPSFGVSMPANWIQNKKVTWYPYDVESKEIIHNYTVPVYYPCIRSDNIYMFVYIITVVRQQKKIPSFSKTFHNLRPKIGSVSSKLTDPPCFFTQYRICITLTFTENPLVLKYRLLFITFIQIRCYKTVLIQLDHIS